MKKEINVFDYAPDILKGLQKGVLLTTKAGGRVNSMTIGWGTLGIEWATPIFTAFVREHRFTRELLDEGGTFTVNIPYGEVDRKILGVCGTQSGHDTDKIAQLGLTLEEPLAVEAPGIRELPLTLECRVLYKQLQTKEHAVVPDILKMYPQDVDGSFHGANRDFHVAYYGEILKAYIIE